MRTSLILWTLLVALPTSAIASFTPKLNLILPRGAMPGEEVTLQLIGERMEEPQALMFHRPGIEFLGFEPKDEKRLLAKVKIAADAPLGEHPMRLRTTGGISYLRSIWVGQFPTVAEKEPNNEFGSPQKIELGQTIQGVADLEDVDHFTVSLRKGQVLSVEIEAMRLGRRFFDAYIAILDPKGFELAACDDSALLRTDAFASIMVPEDGDYQIVVREAAYEGHPACQYRLHVGSFPRPTGVFPPSAKPGETVSLKFIGDPAGDLEGSFAIPADAEGLFAVHAERDGLKSPSPNWITVSPLETVAEVEPNPHQKQATALPTLPSAANGVLDVADDTDFFRFTAKKNQNLEIRVLGRALRSPIDPTLSLRDGNGKYLEGNDDQDSLDSVLKWRCPEDGDYHVMIRDKLGRGGPDYVYRLEVLTREPSISVSLPLAERNNSQEQKMICVPQGGRYATALNITRANLGGDARFEALSLPEGVTLHVPPRIPRGTTNFPVVFEATAEAPIAGGFHPFRIHATGDKVPPVHGPLRETIHLVEINNQGPYHTVDSEEIAVGVIKQAPFTLTLESHPAPIVPQGVKKLKVTVNRRDGFKKPITLRLPWKPPGIGAPDTVKIEADKQEAHYELNANAEIEPGEWQVVVQGSAETDAGPVLSSSGFAPLVVKSRFVTGTIALGATEQGKDVAVVATLEHAEAFEGKARAELIGLPHGTSTEAIEFDHGTEQLTFPVKVAEDATVGKHSGLFLRIHVPFQGETVLHQTAQGGTLRIDKPRPAVAGKPKEAKDPAKPAAKKPLSRLEQLRQQAKSEP